MKLQFLGTGAATGIPLAFCNCAACAKARKLGGREIRRRAAALVDGELLIDLGPDVPAFMAQSGLDLGQVHYLLQTHAHSDHFDAGHLVTRMAEYAVKGLERLEVMASRETLRAMAVWMKTEEPGLELLSEAGQRALNLSLRPIRAGQRAQMGPYEITALDSRHDPGQQALVYRIRRAGAALLYATDLLALGEEEWAVLREAPLDAAVLDMTYGAGFNAGGHPDADQVYEMARRMRQQGILKPSGRVLATHISHEGNGALEEMGQLARPFGVEIAWDGMILEI